MAHASCATIEGQPSTFGFHPPPCSYITRIRAPCATFCAARCPDCELIYSSKVGGYSDTDDVVHSVIFQRFSSIGFYYVYESTFDFTQETISNHHFT